MDSNRFTEKSQEALNTAHRLAARLGHQQMDVEHLLLALLEQERGLATSVLTKAGVEVEGLKQRVQRELERPVACPARRGRRPGSASPAG